MVTKSVIEIEVSDAQFKDFFQLFEQYKEKLEAMPDDWKAVNAASTESSEALEVTAAAILGSMTESAGHASALTKNLREAAAAQREFGSASNVGSNNLKAMAKDAKALGESVFGIGKFLFKLGAIGIGSAAAGLFGIDALANSAVANQRSGRSLGLTTGQNRAFDNDLSRNIDRSTLTSVADAQNSYVGRVWLARATGMSQTDVQRTDAGSLSAQLALKAHDWWASTPESQHTDANLMATGFTQSGMSLADVRRQGNTPRSELEKAYATYKADAPGLSQSNSSINALYDFSRSLKNAGDHLEIDFANKLSDLNKNGALSSFITNLEKDAEILINGVFTDANMKSMQDGLTTFATYLGSQDFKDDVRGFVDNLKSLAKAMGWIVDRANSVLHPQDASTTDKVERVADDVWENMVGVGKAIWNPSRTIKSAIAGNVLTDPNNQAYLSNLEKNQALQPGLLGATAQVESSGRLDPGTSAAGAQGLFQFMPETAAALGVNNVYDFKQSSTGAAKLYAQLSKRYGGDVRKEIAAYNWKPAALDSDIKKHGADWERFAPTETQNQIQKVLSLMASNKSKTTVNLVVTNKSGTNVAVSANAAAI